MATNSINDKRANSYIPVLLFAFAALVWQTQYYVASLYVAIPLLIVYCFGFIRTLFSNQYTGIFPPQKKPSYLPQVWRIYDRQSCGRAHDQEYDDTAQEQPVLLQ